MFVFMYVCMCVCMYACMYLGFGYGVPGELPSQSTIEMGGGRTMGSRGGGYMCMCVGMYVCTHNYMHLYVCMCVYVCVCVFFFLNKSSYSNLTIEHYCVEVI